jgi:hypothetical protein
MIEEPVCLEHLKSNRHRVINILAVMRVTAGVYLSKYNDFFRIARIINLRCVDNGIIAAARK